MSFWSYLSNQIQHNPLSHWFANLFGYGEEGRMAGFTMAIIALSAKLAKADGQVTRDEVAAFKKVFEIRPEDAPQVGHLYNIARQDTAGFETYARQIGRLFRDEPDMLRDVMTGLLLIAKADGVIDKSEHDFLAQVASVTA